MTEPRVVWSSSMFPAVLELGEGFGESLRVFGDRARRASGFGVDGEWVCAGEVQVAFDRKAQFAS